MTVRKVDHAFLTAGAHDLTAKILFGELLDGVPAVRVNLQSYLEPVPIYTDPALLRRMGAEFLQAATYLERKAKKA